jgi:L-lactate dehydrogenase complex protein LldE
VYSFGASLIDLRYPQVRISGIELLHRGGIEVVYPQQQSGCGRPANSSGFPDEAKKVAVHQIEALPKDCPVIVVPRVHAAGC